MPFYAYLLSINSDMSDPGARLVVSIVRLDMLTFSKVVPSDVSKTRLWRCYLSDFYTQRSFVINAKLRDLTGLTQNTELFKQALMFNC